MISVLDQLIMPVIPVLVLLCLPALSARPGNMKDDYCSGPQEFLEPPGCLVIMGPMEFKEREAQRGREGTPVTLGSKVRHAPFYYLEGGEYDINIIIVSLGFHVRFCQTVCCHGL